MSQVFEYDIPEMRIIAETTQRAAKDYPGTGIKKGDMYIKQVMVNEGEVIVDRWPENRSEDDMIVWF